MTEKEFAEQMECNEQDAYETARFEQDAINAVFQIACNEVAREARAGQATASSSRWYALADAMMGCWPDLGPQPPQGVE